MNVNRTRFFGILFLLCCSKAVFASNSPVYSDAGSWNTFNINYNLTKRWGISFTEELRLRENYSRLNLLYTNIGIDYKYNKYLKTSLIYRFTNKFTDENRFSMRHRIMWDVVLKYPVKSWALSYRHRLQVENRNILSSESGKVPEWYSRHKVEFNYKLTKKISPYVSGEFRYQLFDPRNVESDHTWHRARWQGGVDYTYSSKSKFGLYYMVQHEFNVSAQENIFITGLEYSLSLN